MQTVAEFPRHISGTDNTDPSLSWRDCRGHYQEADSVQSGEGMSSTIRCTKRELCTESAVSDHGERVLYTYSGGGVCTKREKIKIINTYIYNIYVLLYYCTTLFNSPSFFAFLVWLLEPVSYSRTLVHFVEAEKPDTVPGSPGTAGTDTTTKD